MKKFYFNINKYFFLADTIKYVKGQGSRVSGYVIKIEPGTMF